MTSLPARVCAGVALSERNHSQQQGITMAAKKKAKKKKK